MWRDKGYWIIHSSYYIRTIFKHFIDYRLKQYQSLKIDISGGYVTLILLVLIPEKYGKNILKEQYTEIETETKLILNFICIDGKLSVNFG